MNYIEAVQSLPTNFTPSELEELLKEIKPKWYGRVKPLFIVLSDDMIKKRRGPKKGNSNSATNPGKPSEASADSETEPEMDVDDEDADEDDDDALSDVESIVSA